MNNFRYAGQTKGIQSKIFQTCSVMTIIMVFFMAKNLILDLMWIFSIQYLKLWKRGSEILDTVTRVFLTCTKFFTKCLNIILTLFQYLRETLQLLNSTFCSNLAC